MSSMPTTSARTSKWCWAEAYDPAHPACFRRNKHRGLRPLHLTWASTAFLNALGAKSLQLYHDDRVVGRLEGFGSQWYAALGSGVSGLLALRPSFECGRVDAEGRTWHRRPAGAHGGEYWYSRDGAASTRLTPPTDVVNSADPEGYQPAVGYVVVWASRARCVLDLELRTQGRDADFVVGVRGRRQRSYGVSVVGSTLATCAPRLVLQLRELCPEGAGLYLGTRESEVGFVSWTDDRLSIQLEPYDGIFAMRDSRGVAVGHLVVLALAGNSTVVDVAPIGESGRVFRIDGAVLARMEGGRTSLD